MGKFLALGHATRPSYGGPKFDFLDFPLDFALEAKFHKAKHQGLV